MGILDLYYSRVRECGMEFKTSGIGLGRPRNKVKEV